MTFERDEVVAFAPASVGNVGVGFDVLGHSMNAVGDRVRATRTAARGVTIRAIEGVVRHLPIDPDRNTASVAVQAMLEAIDPGHGFELTIEKGIPLGSGLGGSAASAVAAVVAANALLARPFDKLSQLKFAMRGEKVASAARHADPRAGGGARGAGAYAHRAADAQVARSAQPHRDALRRRLAAGESRR